MLYDNTLYWINNCNGADYGELFCCAMLRKKFQNEHLIGVIMGSAYGGSGEAIGKLWLNNGEIHLFDTFEGHPDYLSEDINSFEARCMDRWILNTYAGKQRIPHLNREMLTYEYQRGVLDFKKLNNVHLHKGLVKKDSLKDFGEIHYAMLDMDLISSMKTGYEAIKNKIKKGGFLALHDCNPRGHIEGLWEIYQDILATGGWKEIIHCDTAYLIVLEKL